MAARRMIRPRPDRCQLCGRREGRTSVSGYGELHWSDAAGAWTCLRCHLAADPSPPVPLCDFEREVDGRIERIPSTRHPARSVPAWEQFRRRVLDALDEIAPERFVYVSQDRAIHICPHCRAPLPESLSIHFHGETPRADLVCSLGCSEQEIVRALAKAEARR
jgi:hypothetical protein